MQYFWTYTIWYILLGILTVCELLFVFTKVKNRKFTLAFYFTVTGITLAAEVTLFFVFGAYNYYPKIILTSYYDDQLTGNLFSQFSLSATALIIATFNLKFHWIIIFAATYGIIEELFLALGIYSHNWYKTWYTVVGLILLFVLIKINYQKSLKGVKSLLHYLNIFFSLITLDVITIIWGFMLSGYQYYSRDLGYNPVASPYLIGNIFSYFIAISLMLIYFFKLRLRFKSIVISLLYGLTYILSCLKIIYFKNIGWLLIFSTIYIFGTYFSIVLMDYLYRSDRELESAADDKH